jgi:hypothetical protein
VTLTEAEEILAVLDGQAIYQRYLNKRTEYIRASRVVERAKFELMKAEAFLDSAAKELDASAELLDNATIAIEEAQNVVAETPQF